MRKPNIIVLGDGGWGTTLAITLNKKGYEVTLWGAFEDYVAHLHKKRINTRFLPDIRIPKAIEITHDLARVDKNKDIVIIAVPSQYMRSVLRKLRRLKRYPKQAIYVSVTKGIEVGSLKMMSQVIRDELGLVKIAVLSGPTIAREIARGIPTTAVVACEDVKIRKYLQDVFITDRFRIYTNKDTIGVELGGSLKNVIAIACGISDGLRFGTNTKAALLARGLAEISRLGKAMGAKAETFSGVSGLGDLVTTCISPYSRNRFVGEQIGKGKTLKKIKADMQMIAEGMPTTKSAYKLGLRYKVDMPIIREVYNVLYRNKSPLKAVENLMRRKKKEE